MRILPDGRYRQSSALHENRFAEAVPKGQLKNSENKSASEKSEDKRK